MLSRRVKNRMLEGRNCVTISRVVVLTLRFHSYKEIFQNIHGALDPRRVAKLNDPQLDSLFYILS